MSILYSQIPKNLRIGVVRGGPSSEYDVSLNTGMHVLNHLSETHRPIDIVISKNNIWHENGLERSPDRILKHVDVIFNALHGTYGEDGGIQEILDYHNIPYTGSGKYESAVAMNKFMTKERAMNVGVKTPVHILVRDGDDVNKKINEVFKTLPYPIIIKPVSNGSSFGITVANNPDELIQGIEKAFSLGGGAIIEEFISGREATCGVIDSFRGKEVYSLPPVEIIPPEENNFFDYDAKYSGKSREICPGHFSEKEKKEIEEISALIHKTLGLKHYSRSDFIISPRRGIYFLEVNTLPGLTKESLLPKSLEAIGVKMKDFIHHIINLALDRK